MSSSHMASGNITESIDTDEDFISTSSDISEIQSNEGNTSATILRDSADFLSKIRSLHESDVLVLLTPIVVPISQDITDTSDPFECLGRALARRHAKVRHIPYTRRNGITSTHLGFIKRSHVIILCFVDHPEHQNQFEIAEVLFAVSDHKPCDQVNKQDSIPFPTVILTSGYTPEDMEAAAAVIFGEREPSPNIGITSSTSGMMEAARPKLWAVDQWNESRDVPSVLKLWSDNFDVRFSIDVEAFVSLLHRPGYAKHYVVRDPRTSEVLGFCATYLSYVDQEGERLIASLAIIVVEKTYRRQGIGLSLHNHAIGQFRGTRGVIQLTANDEWFRRRGWTLNKELRGQGQRVYDLILDFTKWKYQQNQQQERFQYRQSVQDDMVEVLHLVEESSIKQGNMGWFDQYFALMNGPNVKDIIICLEGDQIIATALTYTPFCGSSISSNLPWAGRIGHDVGGVTCICISPQRKEPIGPELIDACIKKLYQQGMRRMFYDGVANDVDELKQLGFEEWAKYRDVWKDT
ncbi:glycoside hydrolase family 3 [Botrytis cinerea]